MKNKLLYILFFAFIFFDFGLFIYYYSPIGKEQKFSLLTPTPASLVNNASPTPIDDNTNTQILDPGSPNLELSRPLIFNANIDKNSDIEGLFFIKNKENISVSGISITLELVKDQERNSLEIIDRQLLPDILSFKPYEKKEIKFKKTIPKSINDGSYFLRINAQDQTGLPLQFTAAIFGNVAGDNNFLDINWRDSKVVKKAEEFQPLEGPTFAPYESPKIVLIVKNPHNYPISAYPWFVIYPRDQLPKVSAIADYQEKPIEFPAKKETKLTFSLPGQARPESYLTYLRFLDEKKQLISSLQEFRFVVAGEGGKILNFKAAAEQLFFKTKVKIKAALIGPADDSTSENITFQTQVLSSDNKKILGSFSKKVNLTAEELFLDFPIQFFSKFISSKSIIVKAELIGKNNNLLHAVEQKILLEIVKSTDYSSVILISLALIVLLIIFIAVFVLRKKKILRLSKIQFFFVFLILIFTAVFLFLLFRFLLFSQPTVSADSQTCEKTNIENWSSHCTYEPPSVTFSSASLHPNDDNRTASDLREYEDVTLMGSGSVRKTCDNATASYTVEIDSGGGISGMNETFTLTSPSGQGNFDAGGNWTRSGKTKTYGNYSGAVTHTMTLNSMCYECKLGPIRKPLPYSIKRQFWTCNKSSWSCYFDLAYKSKGSDDYEDSTTCEQQCVQPTSTPTPEPELPPEISGEISVDPPTPTFTPVPPTPTITPEPPTPTFTPMPEPYHAACEGTTTCKKVEGAGVSSCTPIGGSCSAQWRKIPRVENECGLTSYSEFCDCTGPCCANARCDGSYVCGGGYTSDDCKNKAPNDKYRPEINFIRQPDDDEELIQTRDIKINWSYEDKGMGCTESDSWGFYDADGMDYGCNTDCAKCRFVIKITSGPSGATTLADIIPRSGASEYTYTTLYKNFSVGGDYTIKVCPKNGADESDDSACSDLLEFTKHAFPEGKVAGELLQHPKENASGDYQWCEQGIAADPRYLDIHLKPEYSVNWLIFNPCTFTKRTKEGQAVKISYSCTFKYDNQNYDVSTTGASPDYLYQKIKLMVDRPADDILYKNYYCIKNETSIKPPKCKEIFDNQDKCMNEDYSQPNPNNDILKINGQTGTALYLNFDRNDNANFPLLSAGTYGTGCDDADPEKCISLQRNDLNIVAGLNVSNGGGGETFSFFKLRSASFADKGVINSEFPTDPLPFDNDDDKYTDTGKTGIYFITDETSTSANRIGAVLSNGTPILGALDPEILTQRKIKTYNYSVSRHYNASSFIQYLKSKKNIESISDLSNLQENKINFWSGALPLSINNDGLFKNKKIILVVAGDVYFETKNFLKDDWKASTLIIAASIHFYKNNGANPPETFVNNAGGLFFADTIDFGDSNSASSREEPLKIIGNVISSNNIEQIKRTRYGKANLKKPALFIIFNPFAYIELLPLLSTNTYQWSELNPFE